MFRDDQQRDAVCNAFLRHFGKPALFAPAGPKPEVLEYVRGGYPGSRKEADFFRLAWALWDGDADIGLRELLTGLDRRSYQFLASFMEALGSDSPDALDVWAESVPKPAGEFC